MSLLAENKAILAQIAEAGSDLKNPRVIDFEHIFPDEKAARQFAALAEEAGRATAIWQADDGEWNVTAKSTLVPTAKGITDIETQLDQLAKTVGGKADGWGFWRTD
jgi:hypothetical protein